MQVIPCHTSYIWIDDDHDIWEFVFHVFCVSVCSQVCLHTCTACVQVELRKREQQLERQSERLNVSQRVIAEQEEELAEVTKELEETERENTRLRHSMEKMLEETDYSRQAAHHTHCSCAWPVRDFLLPLFKIMAIMVESQASWTKTNTRNMKCVFVWSGVHYVALTPLDLGL